MEEAGRQRVAAIADDVTQSDDQVPARVNDLIEASVSLDVGLLPESADNAFVETGTMPALVSECIVTETAVAESPRHVCTEIVVQGLVAEASVGLDPRNLRDSIVSEASVNRPTVAGSAIGLGPNLDLSQGVLSESRPKSTPKETSYPEEKNEVATPAVCLAGGEIREPITALFEMANLQQSLSPDLERKVAIGICPTEFPQEEACSTGQIVSSRLGSKIGNLDAVYRAETESRVDRPRGDDTLKVVDTDVREEMLAESVDGGASESPEHNFDKPMQEITSAWDNFRGDCYTKGCKW